jgi:hypothetical protein
VRKIVYKVVSEHFDAVKVRRHLIKGLFKRAKLGERTALILFLDARFVVALGYFKHTVAYLAYSVEYKFTCDRADYRADQYTGECDSADEHSGIHIKAVKIENTVNDIEYCRGKSAGRGKKHQHNAGKPEAHGASLLYFLT